MDLSPRRKWNAGRPWLPLLLMLVGWVASEVRVLRQAEGSDAQGSRNPDLLVVKSNDSERAKSVCEEYGFRFVRKVFEDENYYLFQKDVTGEHTLGGTPDVLGTHSEIEWSSRQSRRRRVRRFRRSASEVDRWEGPNNATPTFNDPLFGEQWYLHNLGQTGSPPSNDIRVWPVWRAGLTGRGVAIAVLDDGVHGRNEEVADNYDSSLSAEFLFRKIPPSPVPENSHGTRCAAVAAGVANNGICGVGVAYEARVGGVRLLEGPFSDVQEALALVHALDRVDIYTASWGPSDKGRAVDGPRILARMAFLKGVTQGRRGKGSLYVWAAGNGGGYRDHCALDGYASSPFTLTIGALTEDGRSAFYSEPCPAVIASVYVGGRAHDVPDTRDWKRDKTRVKVIVPSGRGQCESTFQGTSAAAPMAAGVIALALQANPELTWRDVQHLIIGTSRVPEPPESGWIRNAAGFHFHPKMGSGALDALALVNGARSWKTVDALRFHATTPDTTTRCLPCNGTTPVAVPILKSAMRAGRRVDRLEAVIATVSVRHGRRGQLSATLRSPGGTTSPLLTRRPLDKGTSGFDRWDLVSLHFWGEDPEGVWTLTLSNHHPTMEGFLDYLAIQCHGTGPP